MMSPIAWLSREEIVALGWTLLHFCWQGTAVAVVFSIADRMTSHATSKVRYVVALAAFMLMPVVVLGTFTETTEIPGNLTVHTGSFTSTNGMTVNGGATFNSPVVFNNIFTGTGVTFNGTSQINGDVTVFGRITFGFLPAGTSPVCFAPGFTIAACGSSLRYKTNLAPYIGGLEIIDRLKPITFTWKQYGTRDVGLAAEDVAAVEPFFTFNNNKGDVEGVKYDRLSVVFINAFKEQQAQIQNQQQQSKEHERQFDSQQRTLEQYRKQLSALQSELEGLNADGSHGTRRNVR